jgi:hypothetical protein
MNSKLMKFMQLMLLYLLEKENPRNLNSEPPSIKEIYHLNIILRPSTEDNLCLKLMKDALLYAFQLILLKMKL